MGRIAKVLALVAVFSIGAAVPAEAATKVPTRFRKVTSFGIEGVDNVSAVDGKLKSEKAKCIVNRTVYVSWWNGSSWIPYGNDATDTAGYFYVEGSGPYYYTHYGLAVAKVTIGKTICKAAVLTGRFD